MDWQGALMRKMQPIQRRWASVGTARRLKPGAPGSGGARLAAALKMALAFSLLTLVIVWNREQIRDVLSRRPDVRVFALGFFLYLAGMLLAFVRWSFYVRALEIPFRIRDGLRLGFVANLFNFVVPGGPVGGDVIRAAFLCREHASWKTRAIASVVLDRLVGLLALFLLASGAGTLAWGELDAPVRRLVLVAWVISLVVILILAVAFSPALYRPLCHRFAHRKRLERRLH
jgi:glycosyltransferase 2 family protein